MTDVELQDSINKKIFFIIISYRKIKLCYIKLGENQREFSFGHTVCNDFELVRGYFEYIELTYWLKIIKKS